MSQKNMPSTTRSLILFSVFLLDIVQSKPLLSSERAVFDIIPTCSSPIYCQGDLLNLVQLSGIFTDSKTFVDMSQINSVDETLENFSTLIKETNNQPTKEEIEQFVNENFVSANETVQWTPSDYNSNPKFLLKIIDDNVRAFAKNLISIWPTLGRKVSSDVEADPEKHSIIPIPNGFIIPGGRFRESYYWDSYWIIRGLLISGMTDTVRGMLDNFCYLIDQYGFIPNGARVYYLNRSQPPLFTLMVALYIEETDDIEWLIENIHYLEIEAKFWLNNRTETVEKDNVAYQAAHYISSSNTPRSESYKEDYTTCNYYTKEDEKRICYQSLKSGAETGWDFSSRWFFDANGGTETNLTDVKAQRVIPVDLNAYLYKVFKELSNLHGKIGNKQDQLKWLEMADLWSITIQNLLYNNDDGIWYDYDAQKQVPRKYFYPSNLAPLWAGAYNASQKDEYGKRASKYLDDIGITEFQGGIPTSLKQSGEQWDFSNAWPPLQEIVIVGLLNTGNKDAVDMADLFATRWISANMKGYKESQIMYEKYDAVQPGEFGGGGEYTVQAGFGWTNGVALHLIKLFYSTN